MDTIVAKYQWTVDELTNGLRWHNRQATRPFFRIAIWVMFVLFFVAGAGILLAGDIQAGAMICGFGFVGLVARRIATPIHARFLMRNSPDRDEEVVWRLAPESIQITTSRGSVQLDWGLLVKVADSPDGLLFYFAPSVFHWLPRHAFAIEAEHAAASELARKNSPTFVECERSLLPRMQFGLRNIMWAMFWACIWAGALAHLITFIEVHRPLQKLPWSTMLIAVLFPLFIVVWSPAVAIGALFDNVRRGMAIGFIPVIVVVILVLFVVV